MYFVGVLGVSLERIFASNLLHEGAWSKVKRDFRPKVT